jgi:hypothetical protein
VSDAVNAEAGIRFKPDPRSKPWGDAEVCGYGKHTAFMEAIISELFGKTIPLATYFQINKCRYALRMRDSEFREGMKRVSESGLIVEQVRNLGRLVR